MPRISRIEVQNFKSLVNFTIDLPKFTCLIGLNGSGKSTVLQFIDFLSQLVRGDMRAWLRERRWNRVDIRSKLSRDEDVRFRVFLTADNGDLVGHWSAAYNPYKNVCTEEIVRFSDAAVRVEEDSVAIEGRPGNYPQSYPIALDYEGSILSALKVDLLPPALRDFKRTLLEVKSLELLAPEKLRTRSRESSGTLGLGGQNLAAFLHELSEPKRRHIRSQLKKAYPHIDGMRVRSLRSGWKQLEIHEDYEGHESMFQPQMTSEARHINDGMLRLIAILAELQSEHQFLLFDEIENGINPELVEFVLDALVTTNKQVVVTTHSPMILNYLDDETARRGVIYLYKTPRGETKSIPFFSIPSLAEKLKVMGPGEAFVDTNLTALGAEIEAMTEKQ